MRGQNSIWRSKFLGDAVIEEWSLRGKGASGGSIGDTGSWIYTKTERAVLQIGKKSERKTELSAVTKVRDGIVYRWIK